MYALVVNGAGATLNGVHYRVERARGRHACRGCAAYNNMRLCDVLAPYCPFGHVFVRDKEMSRR